MLHCRYASRNRRPKDTDESTSRELAYSDHLGTLTHTQDARQEASEERLIFRSALTPGASRRTPDLQVARFYLTVSDEINFVLLLSDIDVVLSLLSSKFCRLSLLQFVSFEPED